MHREYYFDKFPTKCNSIQFIYFWKTALHVSGGISTHHQEYTQLYLRYLVLVNRYCYLPLLWESWNWPECGVGIVPICFPEINKLCNVASRWKYIKRNILTMHGPLNVKCQLVVCKQRMIQFVTIVRVVRFMFLFGHFISSLLVCYTASEGQTASIFSPKMIA